MATSRDLQGSTPSTPAEARHPTEADVPTPLLLSRGKKRKTLSPAKAPIRPRDSSHASQGVSSTPNSTTPPRHGDSEQHGHAKRPRRSDSHQGLSGDLADEVDPREEQDHFDAMADEKKFFPGSAAWADDELRLFETLYMRQYNPLLPRKWDMDFRGIPIPGVLFSKNDDETPVICSQSGNEFKATKALIQLIELTSSVRSLMQSGQRDKVPICIRKELEEYARWAAQDGSYDNLDIVPNVIIDIVDTTVGSIKIEERMQNRLRTLAARHRAYWLINRSGRAVVPRDGTPDGLVKSESDDDCTANSQRHSTSPLVIKREDGGTEIVHLTDESKKQRPSIESPYMQQPPVLYGMFIVNATVMILSIDSAKEDDVAQVSYQVEVGFNVKNQGVWNAITVAIVMCLARDHMMTLTKNFVQLSDDADSDPDA
ncbi:hypothetical protein VdG1_07572 [Verticillium dahliae VDG1]|nr:hypothetical protein VdG1_07572 [Verticillium dahliae VDG1]